MLLVLRVELVIVERKATSKDGVSSFYNSVDIFTKTAECAYFGAECFDSTCDMCKCKPNEVFISYNMNCQNVETTKGLLGGKFPRCNISYYTCTVYIYIDYRYVAHEMLVPHKM